MEVNHEKHVLFPHNSTVHRPSERHHPQMWMEYPPVGRTLHGRREGTGTRKGRQDPQTWRMHVHIQRPGTTGGYNQETPSGSKINSQINPVTDISNQKSNGKVSRFNPRGIRENVLQSQQSQELPAGDHDQPHPL